MSLYTMTSSWLNLMLICPFNLTSYPCHPQISTTISFSLAGTDTLEDPFLNGPQKCQRWSSSWRHYFQCILSKPVIWLYHASNQLNKTFLKHTQKRDLHFKINIYSHFKAIHLLCRLCIQKNIKKKTHLKQPHQKWQMSSRNVNPSISFQYVCTCIYIFCYIACTNIF